MSKFRKYDHLVRHGHPDAEFIESGLVHIFPKLDGTNASGMTARSSPVLGPERSRQRMTTTDSPHGLRLTASAGFRLTKEFAEDLF